VHLGKVETQIATSKSNLILRAIGTMSTAVGIQTGIVHSELSLPTECTLLLHIGISDQYIQKSIES